MLKADLHIHSSASYDSRTTPGEVVATCLRRGLGAFAIADHNALHGSLAAAALVASPAFARFMADHYPGRPPLLAVVAQEVNAVDGELLGMFLRSPLPRGLSLVETALAIREQGGVVTIPHPFARVAHRRPKVRILEEHLDLIDAVEVFNARNAVRLDDRFALEFARRHGLGRTAGSDGHLRSEIGRGFVRLEPFDDAPSFLRALRAARPGGRKTFPLFPLATWLRNLPAAVADLRLQRELTGRY